MDGHVSPFFEFVYHFGLFGEQTKILLKVVSPVSVNSIDRRNDNWHFGDQKVWKRYNGGLSL